ncbi:uncharacterized protein G2W53_017682 [Senna tora]|uniref:Uncharacterized protein n=1 Tax=Senna tora TaxID=362788 RepID=A0A834WMP3_9FABA|nr:uncharacterized protein G2W53_017682 [Senna tora]
MVVAMAASRDNYKHRRHWFVETEKTPASMRNREEWECRKPLLKEIGKTSF